LIHHVQEQMQKVQQELKNQLGRESRKQSPVAWLIAVFLLILIFGLFLQLWVGNGTIPDIFFLNQDIQSQKLLNQALQKENTQRVQQIKSLKGGDEELEARARSEIGMIKPGEIFYEVPSRANLSSNLSSS
jgi:cell division protein FtsB